MRTSHLLRAVAAAAAVTTTCVSHAAITGFVGDTTLEGGWYAFEDTFDVDMTVIHHGGAIYQDVLGIDIPEYGGSLDFDSPHSLRHIGQGWATWSHGYMGEVFYTNGKWFTGYDIKVDGAYAFDAYVEPNCFAALLYDWYEVTAYGSMGSETTVEFGAHGSAGANHFGFYASDEAIVRIEIESTCDWAIGEWRIAAPAPGATALLVLTAVRRRHRR